MGAMLLGGAQALTVAFVAATTHRDAASERAAGAVRSLGDQPAIFALRLVAALALAGFAVGVAQAALRSWAGWREDGRGDARHVVALSAAWVLRRALEHPALLAAALPFPGALAWLSVHATPRALDALLALYAVACLARGAMRRRRPGALAVAAVLALAPMILAHQEATPPARARDGRPNVLVLAADSLRPDHFSVNGYRRPTTPNLDDFARAGTSFDRAYATLARTTSSWVSMLTGQYPHRHGVRHMFPDRRARPRSMETVVRSARGAGYRTAVISDYAGDFFPLFDFGFDRAVVPPPLNLTLVAERALVERSALALAFLGPLPEGLRPRSMRHLMAAADPRRMADEVVGALDGDGPFFVVAFFSTTHVPFASPAPYYRQWANPTYGGAQRFSYEVGSIADLRRAESALARRDAQQVIDLYDGALSSVDAAMGRVLGALTARGLDANTLVVVLSDHGENLFEPGQTTLHGKWFRGGDEASRVPFILRGPGVARGRRVASPVSLADLAPTLCELARIPCPGEMDGRSLRPAFSGELAPRPVFAESGEWLTGSADPLGLRYPPLTELLTADDEDHGQLIVRPQYEDLMVRAKHRAVWDDRWKLVYEPREGGPRYQLFDLAADPGQQRDLGADHPEARRLITALRAWLAQDPERVLGRDDLLERRDEH